MILTVLKIEPAVTKSFAEVAPQLRNDLALERAKTQVQDSTTRSRTNAPAAASLDRSGDRS